MPNYFNQNPIGEAAAFGQGVGQNLSQGLLQLPQERYRIAMEQAQMQRALQQMAMTQQYRQGMLQNRNDMLGLRQQEVQNQGLSLQNRSQYEDMANQIKLLAEQRQGDYRNWQMAGGNPRVEGGVFFPGAQGQPQGSPQMTSSPDFGWNGSQVPQGQQQVQEQPSQNSLGAGLPNGAIQLPKQAPVLNQNATDKNNYSNLALYAGLLNSTNLPAITKKDPNLMSVLSNRVYGVSGQGQQTQNALQQNPVTNSIPPQAIQMLRSNPALRGAFEQKYGAGSSTQFLGQ